MSTSHIETRDHNPYRYPIKMLKKCKKTSLFITCNTLRCTFIIIANRCKQSWLTPYADAFSWKFISQMNTSIEESAHTAMSLYLCV